MITVWDNFSQGLLLTTSAESAPDGSLIRASNVWLDPAGTVRARSGRTLLYSGLSVPINALSSSVQRAVTYRYAHANGSLYVNGMAIPGLFTGVVISMVGARPQNAPYTYTYMTDGRNYYKANSTSVFAWGIPVPSVPPNLTVNTTSSTMNGSYSYALTYWNDNAKAEGNPAYTTTTTPPVPVTNQSILLTNFTLPADPQVTHYRLYREGGATSSFTFVVQLPVGTINYLDSAPDTSLGPTILNLDNSPPPVGMRSIFEHQGRLTGITDDSWWYSKHWSPDAFPPTNYLLVSNPGEILQGGLSWNSMAFLWSTNQPYRILGQDPTTYVSQYIEGAPGTNCPLALASTPSGMYYVGPDGIYVCDGTSALKISQGMDPLFLGQAVGPYLPFTNVTAHQALAVLAVFGSELWFSYAQQGQPTNSATVVYDLTLKRIRSIYPVGFDALYNEAGQRLLGSQANGAVYQLESGNSDSGIAIPVEAETGFKTLAHGSSRSLQGVFVDADAGGGTLTISLAVNGGTPIAAVGSAAFAGRTRTLFPVNIPSQSAAVDVTGQLNTMTLYRVAVGDSLPELKRWMERA